MDTTILYLQLAVFIQINVRHVTSHTVYHPQQLQWHHIQCGPYKPALQIAEVN